MNKDILSYQNDVLCVEAIPLSELAQENETPFYCTSVQKLRRNAWSLASSLQEANLHVHYSVKAKPSLPILRTFAQEGLGGTVTSAGELARALRGEFAPSQIIFSGLRKTQDDLMAALIARVQQIQADSFADLQMMDEVASSLQSVAPVVLRLRLDLSESFKDGSGAGFRLEELAQALQWLWLKKTILFKGLSFQTAAFLYEEEMLKKALLRIANTVRLLQGQGIPVLNLDLGGFPVDEPNAVPFSVVAGLVKDIIAPLGCHTVLSFGQRLVQGASLLVSRIVRVHQMARKTVLVLDAGEQAWPSFLLSASQELLPLRMTSGESLQLASVRGSSLDEKDDGFGDDLFLPASLRAGDCLAFLPPETGEGFPSPFWASYAHVPEFLVSGARYALIRRRLAVSEQMGWEFMPEWMEAERAA